MHKEVLRAIAGIDVFPVVSLLLFVVSFAVVLLRVLRLDRASADRLAALPLDEPARAQHAAEPLRLEGGHRGA